jgi:hypothetical protein
MGSGAQDQVDLLAGCFWMVQMTRLTGGLVVFMISPQPELQGRFLILIPFVTTLCQPHTFILLIVSFIPHIHNDKHNDYLRTQSPSVLPNLAYHVHSDIILETWRGAEN